MEESTIKYLKLLHYPLKLENVIDKLDYYPFCSSESTQIDIIYHKSLLLYLICTGYPFENILLDRRADLRWSPMISSVCREGEFRYIQINYHKIFEPIAKLYHTSHFTNDDPFTCFRINEKCMKHIYNVVQETLYTISKEILYKHFLLHYNNFLEFDVVSYIINISLDILVNFN